MSIELGVTARCRITGFQGVVTGLVDYISGCNQALLVPSVDEKGVARPAEWFDVQRLERVGSDKIVLDNQRTPGCDMQPPKR